MTVKQIKEENKTKPSIWLPERKILELYAHLRNGKEEETNYRYYASHFGESLERFIMPGKKDFIHHQAVNLTEAERVLLTQNIEVFLHNFVFLKINIKEQTIQKLKILLQRLSKDFWDNNINHMAELLSSADDLKYLIDILVEIQSAPCPKHYLRHMGKRKQAENYLAEFLTTTEYPFRKIAQQLQHYRKEYEIVKQYIPCND